MNCVITGKPIPFEIREKRLYIDGQDIEALCPLCGVKVNHGDYLSYPRVNEVIEVPMSHYRDADGNEMKDGHEFTAKVILRVFLEAAP